jgi:hypothetical protein
MSDQLFIALRLFILSLISDIEVVQGLGNNVPMPEDEFICLTAAGQRRLRTNQDTYGADTRAIEMGTEYRIQIDCYGPNSSDHATTLCTMLRDPYACDMLAPYGCQPLDASDPTQSALVNGEENYEQRWMLAAMLQFNPITTVSQQFADALNVGIVKADTITPN